MYATINKYNTLEYACMRNGCNYKKAFTLIEIAIVVVIIAVIIAGVSAGSNLVTSAKLRSVITNIDAAVVGVNSFKMQYNALPGDIRNFNSYYPSCTNDANTNCNGNGDNYLDSQVSRGDVYRYENVRAYQHLTLAKLFPGSFDGVFTSSAGAVGLGDNNTPFTSINNTKLSYAFWRWSVSSGNPSSAVILKVAAIITDPENSNVNKPYGLVLTAVQMKAIDTKFDDGIATTGNFTGTGNIGATYCVGATDYNLIVALASRRIICQAHFIIRK